MAKLFASETALEVAIEASTHPPAPRAAESERPPISLPAP
jgi:hypothetical protein